MTNNRNNNNIKSLLDLDPTLDTCGCCEDSALTQQSDNRPGLSAIRYRLGTYDTFMRQLIEQLARPALPGYPTLAALKTRRLDDGAIALLDAWATVADVLTFYQERIANENYLLTATERRSVLALARTLGYELNPGVAASTYLAFTVEAATDPHQTAKVSAGTQIQSLPEQDQLPQTFETSTEITARAAWNNLRSPQTRAHVPTGGDRTLYLRGLNTRLAPGDWLLFVGEERLADAESDRWEVRRLLTVEPDAKANHTRVTWDLPLTSNPLPQKPSVYTFRTRANIYGHNAQSWRSLPDNAKATYLGLNSPDELTQADKREWPAYSILAPKGAIQLGDEAAPIVATSYPTPQFVAAAVKSAIRGEIGRSKNRVMTAAANIPNDVVAVFSASNQVVSDVVSTTQQLVTASVDGLVDSVNTIVAGNFALFDEVSGLLVDVVNTARQMLSSIEAVANGLSDVAAQVDNAAFSVPEGLNVLSTFLNGPSTDADDDPTVDQLRTLQDAIDTLEENSPVGIVNNFADTLLGLFGSPGGDRTILDDYPIPSSITPLANAVSTLQSHLSGNDGLTATVSQSIGAVTAGQIIELAVEAALQAPRPLPPPTAQSVADVATIFADVAVKVVESGPEAVAGYSALASPVGVVVGASILAFDAVAGEQAKVGANHIRERLVGMSGSGGDSELPAVIEKALAPVKTELSAGMERFVFPASAIDTIDLDAIYSKITANSWVMLSYQNNRALYRVDRLTEDARSDFGLSGKTTRLTLAGPDLVRSVFVKAVRGTLVYAESEALEVADLPLTEPIAGQDVDIQGLVEHLLPGAPLAVSGKVVRAQVDGFERDLLLRSLDQTQTKPIPAGALLWVEALPISLSHQKHRWTLRDLTGFVGTVDATTEQITYAPALETDETVSEIALLKQLPTFNPVTHLQLKA
ncbi:MAG: hypothetical protein AAFP07_12400, partial [Cyanobacteria bacterium J06606_4]